MGFIPIIYAMMEDKVREAGSYADPARDDIPKVFFGKALPQAKNYVAMPFRYVSNTLDISGYCKTKAQGSSSINYPKKNQTVKLYKDADCTEKLEVNFKGWGKQSKFCFKANWIDITHARNIVSARLWGDVVKSRPNYADIPERLRTSPNYGAVDGFPVKVYAAGIYQGRYTINIPKDAWMANMDDDMDNHCILCGESNADNRSLFRQEANIDGSDWTDEVHDDVPDTIKARWNDAISFIVNSTDEEFAAGIGNYFDVQSLIDYYIFGMASCGFDAFGKNQLYMTYDGKKWYATMYDMDSTWGLWWDGSRFVPVDYARTDFQDCAEGEGNLLYIRLAALFNEDIVARRRELKADVLSIPHIMSRFEQFIDVCPPWLVEEDFAETTANGAFTGIPLVTTNNIQQLRTFVAERMEYCDGIIKVPGVPSGYTEMEYIESSGTQYIDTGISGGSSAAYEIVFDPLAGWVNAYEQYFAGAKCNTPKLFHKFYDDSGARNDVVCQSEDWDAGRNDSLFAQDSGKHTVTFDGVDVLVDGAKAGYWTPTPGGWGAANWYVFSSSSEPNLMSTMRLYSLEMHKDGELVRDFVPTMRNSDGVIGLYDLVSNTFFENAGTGVFTGA